jgi:hypothetical protein
MGRKTRVAKASLAAAFLASGGAVASSAGAEANPDAASVQGIVSSYFGELGLQAAFQQYLKENAPVNNFLKWWKIAPGDAIRGVDAFSAQQKVAPPPIFRGEG